MATRETSRSRNTNRSRTSETNRAQSSGNGQASRSRDQQSQRSAFSWDNGGRTVVMGAAVAGMAAGLAANFGRKFIVQFATGRSDWLESLKNEHEMTLAIFDKIEATRDDQTMMRGMLTMQLKHALGKHALEEENVIYPALREANEAVDADHLNADHGYVKTFLYELDNMPKDSPEWIAKVREFRTMLEAHIQEEEERIFPEFRAMLTEEQNKKLSMALHKEGMKLA